MSSLARIIIGPPAAPALVLLHGITGSAISQAEAIEHWAERGYRVIALDARGHGLSPRWSPEELARAGQVLVDDVVETLEELAHEGSALPILIGHSMGAATAMVLATQRPDLVAGLVLEDPALYGTRSPEELLARGAARERSRAAEAADPAASVSHALESQAMPAVEAVVGVWAAQRSDPALLLSGVVTPEVPGPTPSPPWKCPPSCSLGTSQDPPGSGRRAWSASPPSTRASRPCSSQAPGTRCAAATRRPITAPSTPGWSARAWPRSHPGSSPRHAAAPPASARPDGRAW